MGRIGRHGVYLLAAATLAASNAFAVDITIDVGTKYQTIEGFGAFMSIASWKYKSGPFYVNINLDSVAFYDTLISELGATMFRTDVPAGGLEPSNGTWDLTAVSGNAGTMRKLVAAANRHGEPIHFFCSNWSPPGWMKSNGSESNGGNLLASDRAALGALYAKYVQTIKDSTGVDYYALSIQNEPDFSEPYGSCVYDGTSYHDALVVIAPLVLAVSPNIGFIGAEHMSWAFPDMYTSAIRADATALGYMHAWAVHGYTDGIHSDTGSYAGSSPTDKPLWMSETSGGGYGVGINDWAGAMMLADNILGYLRNGKMTMWTWWSLQNVVDPATAATDSALECIILNGTKTQKYWASSHFYRFIRPGARQVSSSSTDATLELVAFQHQQNNCLTIELVNKTAASKTVNNINITGMTKPATFECHESDTINKRVMTSVSSAGPITIPANSIVTLVSGTYRGTPSSVRPQDPRSMHGQTAAGSATRVARSEYFTLRGQRLPTNVSLTHQAQGIVLERTVSAGVEAVKRIASVNGN